MTPPMSVGEQVGVELAALVERVRLSMVRIGTSANNLGSGTIWDASGLIVTNAHVAFGDDLQVTTADGRLSSARLVGLQHETDIAVLRVNVDGLLPIERGDPRETRPGELVFSMGHPWGSEDGLTVGVFIGLERALPGKRGAGANWIAASLHLRPGHSGGPMFDGRGRLLGLNTVMQGPDVGVAVPVHTIDQIVREVPQL